MINISDNYDIHAILSAIISLTEREADGHNTTICGLARIGLNTVVEAMERHEPVSA